MRSTRWPCLDVPLPANHAEKSNNTYPDALLLFQYSEHTIAVSRIRLVDQIQRVWFPWNRLVQDQSSACDDINIAAKDSAALP
ncbi:hypothetical protein [Absidia glauca]|uniref:Uncharacterized protein n=1 Tax=Absidia glauca TaxID=4829 RepID=A0A163MB12_ABSGL|nr:hypothetical protein [Absidia glauca]